MTRHREAPSATAASTCSRLASTRTIARTPRATRGQPSRTKMPVSDATTTPGGSTSGSAARSATTAYTIGSTSRTSPPFSTAASTRPPAVPAHAPSSAPTTRVAQGGEEGQPQRRPHAEQGLREHVPAERVGAEQEHRRVVGRATTAAARGRPLSARTAAAAGDRPAAPARHGGRRRRCGRGIGGANGYPAKRCDGAIRRQRRGHEHGGHEDAEEPQGRSGHRDDSRAARAGQSPRARGPPASVATARKAAPAAPQPATSQTSRACSASTSSRPSPGQAVTASTTNDPLNSDATMTP